MTPADRDLHTALGIDADLLTRAQVFRVSDAEARDLLAMNGKAGDYSGVVYPYLHPDTGQRLTLRLRRDRYDNDHKKYRVPYGDHRHLYFPPGCASLLHDTTVSVVLVEAEKSALAITAAAARAGRQRSRHRARRTHLGRRPTFDGPDPEWPACHFSRWQDHHSWSLGHARSSQPD